MIDIAQMQEDYYGAKPLWEDRAKRFLKAELARADIGYRELAERLKKHGLKESEASIANKGQPGYILGDVLVSVTHCD